MTSNFDERIRGLLFGLAAGDRIGGPTQMAFRVAGSLSAQAGLDISDVGCRYLEWWQNGAFDTGPTADRVLALVASGIPFEQAAFQADQEADGLTAGCNPSHRCAPLAACAIISDAELARAAIAEARLTHHHPLAGDVAAAVACLCRALIRGKSWPEALNAATIGRSPETSYALDPLAADQISASGFAPDVLGAAVYFIQTSSSFSEALARSIHFAGPSNYCTVLVGSIGGARWGCSQVPANVYCHHGALLPGLIDVAMTLSSRW